MGGAIFWGEGRENVYFGWDIIMGEHSGGYFAGGGEFLPGGALVSIYSGWGISWGNL